MKYPQLVSMPSAVSDWLEEQLEARGIDAVVYTRYILSLLHSHPVDVIHPDEDLEFSRLKKEVRRSGGGRKRFRGTSSDWWRHAQADAEQIKRSAAVECLMSASDQLQEHTALAMLFAVTLSLWYLNAGTEKRLIAKWQNCEIESLVDELCEKLKEVVKSAPASPAEPFPADASIEKITPQELAEKYYAAFPPLCPQTPGQTSALISLVPKWKQNVSPVKKKGTRKLAGRQGGYEQKLHSKVDSEMMKARSQAKQRFTYLSRNKNSAPRKLDSFTGWDFSMFSHRRFGGLTPQQSFENEVSADRTTENSYDQCISDVWTNDDDMNMYEDLPVDIKELLDSPDPQDDTVEMMNMANMKDDGKRGFIPYGTNIMSSIWSNDQDVSYDNSFNAAVDSESTLDFKFSAISIDNNLPKQSEDWPDFENSNVAENETNSFFENNRVKRSLFLDGFRSLPLDWKKVETEKEGLENEAMINHLAISLRKLNHNKENSCFTEILPNSQRVFQNRTFNPFSRTNSMFSFNSRHSFNFDREKEDLLTSERSHFKPIAEKVDQRIQKQYADGATFIISNNLEKVEYKRSESGTMWLETGLGQSKKYFEYKLEDNESTGSTDLDFVLKFSICQNDKACQTEEVLELNSIMLREKTDNKQHTDSPDRPADSSPTAMPDQQQRCTCLTAAMEDLSTCPIHRFTARPDSVLGEFLWKYEVKTCEKCSSNNVQWNVNWSTPVSSEWDSENLRNIWNGGEICQSCLNLNDGNAGGSGDRTPPSIQNIQLREDISQDGEQLLSDLTNLQKSYMEELPLIAEMNCDISELVSAAAEATTSKERKRRHSFIIDEQGSWSFASRLEEDCLIQMSTLPTLRSVTL